MVLLACAGRSVTTVIGGKTGPSEHWGNLRRRDVQHQSNYDAAYNADDRERARLHELRAIVLWGYSIDFPYQTSINNAPA